MVLPFANSSARPPFQLLPLWDTICIPTTYFTPMPLEVDPGLATLFGSVTRVSVLAVLAGATSPLTAYRIAKAAEVQPIKAYTELRRLRDGGIVREKPSGKGRSVWELSDPEIRSLVGRRTRVSIWEDWRAGTRKRARRADRVIERIGRWDISNYLPNPSVVSNPEEFLRPPEKDAVLARMGLRTSVRKRKPV
jgi:DNA-binding transcriptional ArsR family regulator